MIMNNVKLCSIILITNFISKDVGNIFFEIQLTEKSFIHVTKQNIYYLPKIIVNSLSVLKIIFLDFKENDNLFNYISGELFDMKKILKKEEYIVISGCNVTKYEFYPITITLSSSKNLKKTFIYYLYEGLMNKINAF